MARRRSKIFSERELEVMNAVWKLKKATVKEIRSEMGGEEAGAYTSIATMLKLLENKGALRHEQEGRAYYYIAVSSKEEEQRKALRYIVEGFYDGDVETVIRTLHEGFADEDDENREFDESPVTLSVVK